MQKADKADNRLEVLAVELGLGPYRTIGQLRAVCRRVRQGLDAIELALNETDAPKTKKVRSDCSASLKV